MPKFNVAVEVPFGDNAFAILGVVQKALKKAGATEEEIKQHYADSTSGDYDHLMSVQEDWVVCV